MWGSLIAIYRNFAFSFVFWQKFYCRTLYKNKAAILLEIMMGRYLSFHVVKHKESGKLHLIYIYVFYYVQCQILQAIKDKKQRCKCFKFIIHIRVENCLNKIIRFNFLINFQRFDADFFNGLQTSIRSVDELYVPTRYCARNFYIRLLSRFRALLVFKFH